MILRVAATLGVAAIWTRENPLIGKLVDLTAQSELRYVDPQAARSPLHRAYVRFLASRFANWLSRKVVWKLDPVVMRVTHGRVLKTGERRITRLKADRGCLRPSQPVGSGRP